MLAGHNLVLVTLFGLCTDLVFVWRDRRRPHKIRLDYVQPDIWSRDFKCKAGMISMMYIGFLIIVVSEIIKIKWDVITLLNITFYLFQHNAQADWICPNLTRFWNFVLVETGLLHLQPFMASFTHPYYHGMCQHGTSALPRGLCWKLMILTWINELHLML
jgi:hypothetical protein